ncbi:DUF4374 domain-containing protein [Membranihabitans marinus]|uniref:DUF4374 domain-containing protein n=1 Tax=Membranihabitans marinus TaxID=1227546 RepID=UPI001F2D6B84|nr:DUF4374 domain-containing protein [Membranihabitans marinus]
MKNRLLNLKRILWMIFPIAIAFASCEKDEEVTPSVDPDPDPAVEIKYALSTISGAYPNTTTYIQGLENLDFTTIDNDNAIELTNSGEMIQFGENVFATPFGAPANLVKYAFDEDGIPREEERIIVPGSNVFSTLYFESEEKAYATLSGGLSKLIVFNPSTMRITGEVNLSQVSSHFPEATRTYYLAIEERDGKLYMGVHFEKNFVPVNDSAYVAIIDLASNSFEKLISDGRTGMIFGGSGPNSGIFKDSNGDIYIQGKGTLNEGGTSPSGLLRIKNGESEFDADYFFNMEAATGSLCYGISYFSDDEVFTARVEDASDFWEYLTGQPQFKYYKVDYKNAESLGAVDLPTTYSSRYMVIQSQDENTLLFTTATNDENAVYTYDINTGDTAKKFVSTGGYISGLQVLE